MKNTNVRQATERLLEMAENQELDQYTVILACVKYMSEDEVADMARINEFFDIEEDEAAEAIEDFINHADDGEHDVEALRADIENGNFDIETDSADAYFHENIVFDSLTNGQFTQAKAQCESYGLDYEEQLSNFKS